MRDRNLSRMLEERIISDAPHIKAARDDRPRAIDVLGRFAAIFWVTVDEQGGWWVEDCAVAFKTDGAWRSGRGARRPLGAYGGPLGQPSR